MALSITEQIEAALATGSINYIDLMRIKLSRTEYLYWSTAPVTEKLSAEGRVYEPRITSIDPLPFVSGFKDSSIGVEFENTDGIVKDKANMGILWQEAEVAVCRLFPDLATEYNQIGTWDDPYWWGWISQAPSFEIHSKMQISAGFSELTRPALRRFGRTDESSFGSEFFPYDPLDGKGIPQNKVSGTVTGGTELTLTTTDDIGDVQERWLVFVKTKKIVGRVASIIDTNPGTSTITVEDWFYAGDTTVKIPANAESFFCGPAYTEYDGTQESCMNMGMFGANSQQDEDDDLNTDTRRYFTGLTLPGNAYLEPRAAIGSLSSSLFSSVVGEGNDGSIIPVRVGKFQCDLIPLAWGYVEEDGYLHVLGIIGEGRVNAVNSPQLDGLYPVDNVNLTTETYDDSWIVGGILTPLQSDSAIGNDTAAVVSGELTESQQMQAIGSRESYAKIRKAAIDTYKNNPWKFNAADGSGNALGCLAWTRVRFQKEGYQASGTPTVKCRGEGSPMQKADDSWTSVLTPIDVGYYFAKNNLWGGGLPVERLNKTVTTAQSDIAAAGETPKGSNPRVITGVLVAGPDDLSQPSANDLDLPLCIVIIPTAAIGQGETVNYKQITIEADSATEYTYNITRHWAVPDTFYFVPPTGKQIQVTVENTGWAIVVDQLFDGVVPEAGDNFTLQVEASSTVTGNRKYAANGSLIKDCRVGEMLEDIYKNCNGTYYQKSGKIVPIIRDVVDMSDITAKRIFSDWGANRNVIKSRGTSTLKFIPAAAKDVPTSVRVEYIDVDQRFLKRQVTIRNAFAEKRIKELTGEDAKNRKAVILPLCLTGSLEQAVRLGTLYMNEHSFIEKKPNYHPGKFVWQSAIHDAQDVTPMEDVYRLEGENFPDWCQFTRVTSKKDDYFKGIVNLEGMPYLEEMYRYDPRDFIIIPGPVITDTPGGGPLPLIISSLTEVNARDGESGLIVEIDGEITLPS